MSKIYGLCGYIGSGKSTIANLIEKNFDITYIDCDKLYKNILKENSTLQSLNDAFWKSKGKNNNYGSEMFNDYERAIDYPLYRSATDLFRTIINPYLLRIIEDARLSDKNIVIEMASLNTNPIVFCTDTLINVVTMRNEDKIIDTVVERDGRDRKIVENILHVQKSSSKLNHPNTFIVYSHDGLDYFSQEEILYTLKSIIGEATGGTLEKV